MKSVLISIQPKWCELIASGKKTVEVRKTRPKLETPFKCYIYCTKARTPIRDNGRISMYEDDLALTNRFGQGKRVENPNGAMMDGELFLNGKVIGEFVCDKLVWVVAHPSIFAGHPLLYQKAIEDACLTEDEVEKYSSGKDVYGWHISDLVIYDKPRELSEFKKAGFMTEENWLAALYPNTHCHYEAWAKKFEITRPPQSWCFIESEVVDNA